MTGTQLLTKAIGLFDATDTTPYLTTSIDAINGLLAENFDVNNNILVKIEEEPLTVIPEITALTETIPYEDRLVKYAFPYGLAEKLIVGERDTSLISYFHQKYIDAVNDCNIGYAKVVECDLSLL